MAEVSISSLPPATVVNPDDLVPIVQDGVTLRATVSLFPAGGVAGADGQLLWNNGGGIDGTAQVAYSPTGAIITIASATITDIPLTLQRFAGQTSPIQSWSDENDDSLLDIGPDGHIYARQNRGFQIHSSQSAAYLQFAGSIGLFSAQGLLLRQDDYGGISQFCLSDGGGNNYSSKVTMTTGGAANWALSTVDVDSTNDGSGWFLNCRVSGVSVFLIDGYGAVHVPELADATALPGSIYYSTDAGALVYQDSGGTVHPLY